MRVALLTGDELRHAFLRSAIASTAGLDVVRSYCERKPAAPGFMAGAGHFSERLQSEEDFYLRAVQLARCGGKPVTIETGGINDPAVLSDLTALAPDVVAAYGCGIVRQPLLGHFAGRLINVHLGLSPYYRGTGTNFWPLVNGHPEFVGATFMYMDAGVDTGTIIHQIRAEIRAQDTIHQIGNRLIRDVSLVYPEIIKRIKHLAPMPQPPRSDGDKIYRRKDLSEVAMQKVRDNFAEGMIATYLADKIDRDCRAPIMCHPDMPSVETLREWRA